MSRVYETKITDDQLKQELLAGKSIVQISEKYGLNARNVSRKKAILARSGWSPEHDMSHTVPDGYKVRGVSTLYDGAGNVSAQWVKSESDNNENKKEWVMEMFTSLKDELPQVPSKTLPVETYINDYLLAVYPLGDPHIGMLSWYEETNENWDLAIAEKVFCTVFDRVVRTAPQCKECVIFNLGDFFHYDNMEAVTARSGNRLDVDGRYGKMIKVGIKIIRQMIASALQIHSKVKFVTSIGNHDDTGAMFLQVCLAHIYENEPRVIIDTSPAPFHYHRWGKVLLGAHHGHTCKMEKLPGVMAADKAKDWGETEFRYWLTGHIHKDSKSADEFGGCVVESFRTLAAKDAFAAYGGWRSGRDTKCIVYHKDWGEVERHTINIAQIRNSIE